MLIDPVTLKLEDLSAIKLKIRNSRGINFIPRVQIHTDLGVYTATISVVGISNLYDYGLINTPPGKNSNPQVKDQNNSRRNQRSYRSLLTVLTPYIKKKEEQSFLNSNMNSISSKPSHHGRKKKADSKEGEENS